MSEFVFVATLGSSLFCLAVNLYTWRVAYPLWRATGETFPAVHREYLRRLGPVITLPHVLMFFASAALLWWRPLWFSLPLAVAVFAANTLVIAVSLVIAGPVHDRFTGSGIADEEGMRRLIQVSAARSGLMVLSCGILFGAVARVLPGQ